jgi:hypothetical protein
MSKLFSHELTNKAMQVQDDQMMTTDYINDVVLVGGAWGATTGS